MFSNIKKHAFLQPPGVLDPPVIPPPKQNGEPGQSDQQNEGVGDEEVNLNIDNGQDTSGFGKFQKLCKIS